MGQKLDKFQWGDEDVEQLSGSTGLSQKELHRLFTLFQDVATGFHLDRPQFQQALGNLNEYGIGVYKNLPMGLRLFDVFDKNKDGVLDFVEFASGIAILAKGTQQQRIDLTFQVYDGDGSGFVTRDKLENMYVSTYHNLMLRLMENLTPLEFSGNSQASEFQENLILSLEAKFKETISEIVGKIMQQLDARREGRLTPEQFKQFILSFPFVKAQYSLKFTRENEDRERPYNKDEVLSLEVLLSFLQ